MKRGITDLKRFLAIFLLVITGLYVYCTPALLGRTFFTSKITLHLLTSNLDVMLPVIIALIGAHGMWHNHKWGKDVSELTLGLIAFPSFKFLLAHLALTAGLATFIFPLTVILFLLLVFV
jgi:uncharacterized membrane protein (DUF2068 family)